MSTETVAPTETTEDFGTSMADAFDTAMKGAQPPAEKKVDPPKVEPAKADPKPAATKQPESKVEFPDEFISGKKEEPAPADELPDYLQAELHPNSSDKSKSAFKIVKEGAAKHVRSLEEAIAAMKAELETTKATAGKANPEDLKAAIEAREKLEIELERTAFERSPRFQKFVTQEASEIEAAKGYLEEGSEVDASVIEHAARLTGQKRVAALRDAGMDAETIAFVGAHLSRADAIRRERDGALTNWKSESEQWAAQQKQEQAQAETRRKADEDRVFDSVGKSVAGKFEPFMEIEGNDQWNAHVAANKEAAKKFFNGDMSLEDLAEIAYYGVGGRDIHTMYHSLRGKYQDAVKEIAGLKAARPDAGGQGSRTPANTDNPTAWAEQAFNSAMNGGR